MPLDIAVRDRTGWRASTPEDQGRDGRRGGGVCSRAFHGFKHVVGSQCKNKTLCWRGLEVGDAENKTKYDAVAIQKHNQWCP